MTVIDLESFSWAAWADNPYSLYRELRNEKPVYWDEPNRMFVITRAEDLVTVLGDRRRYSNIPLDILDGRAPQLSPLKEEDPPRHQFLRGIIAPLFTLKAMREMKEHVDGVCQELLDDAEKTDIVDISTALGERLPGRITLDLLGLPAEHHPRFHTLVHERFRFLAEADGRVERVARPRTIKDVARDLADIIQPIAEARRREPRTDGISLLVQAQDKYGIEQISDDTFLDMLLHLLTAGYETTQHLIELLGDFFADNDDVWQRLRSDRSLVPTAIEEMLRWESPVQALSRRATEDVELRGVTIPRNSKVVTVYGSANRDERVVEDPDRFRLDRKAQLHFAFSYGIHYCVGAQLSRVEVISLLNAMLDRYQTIERAGASELIQEASPRLSVGKMRGYSRVPVRLVRNRDRTH